MTLAGRIFQSNVNHSTGAQNSLMQSLTESNVLAVAVEPYCIPVRSDWIGDLED